MPTGISEAAETGHRALSPRRRLQPAATSPLTTRTTVDGSGTAANSYRAEFITPSLVSACRTPLPTISTIRFDCPIWPSPDWPIIVNGASPVKETPGVKFGGSVIGGLMNVRTPPQSGAPGMTTGLS